MGTTEDSQTLFPFLSSRMPCFVFYPAAAVRQVLQLHRSQRSQQLLPARERSHDATLPVEGGHRGGGGGDPGWQQLTYEGEHTEIIAPTHHDSEEAASLPEPMTTWTTAESWSCSWLWGDEEEEQSRHSSSLIA